MFEILDSMIEKIAGRRIGSLLKRHEFYKRLSGCATKNHVNFHESSASSLLSGYFWRSFRYVIGRGRQFADAVLQG